MKHAFLALGIIEFLASCALCAMPNDNEPVRVGLLVMAQVAIAAAFVIDAVEKRS